ncbi:cupin domain-containing protein [Mycobacteroides abscessus]|uniref:cupin domain-containing protein n=1 Tax=Mycobacteroides abscessus TaxID=36809 RepID=UPI0009A6C863|nr:cupin domain-containing protein [Mycobacteroides abscessus]SLH42011.1 Cupin domain [Mycobacteroides abscessus subsp. massiliense]
MSTDTSTDNPEKSRQGYIAAQLSDEAKRLGRRGWVIGAFFDRDDPNYCTDLEVKFGQYRAGENPKHPAKISQTTEWTMILAGAVRAWVDGDQVTLHAGDYILIRPGIPNNTLVEVLEDVTVLTVKAPSDPSAKTILAGTAHPVHDDGGEGL